MPDPVLRLFVLIALLSSGCDASKDTKDTETDPACQGASPVLTLTDANNYRFSSTLEVQSYPLQAPGNPTIDWSGLSADLVGHPMDPSTEVLSVGIAIFSSLGQDVIQEAIETDNLTATQVSTFVASHTGGLTSLELGGLSQNGNDIDIEDYFLEGTGTWLLLISDSYLAGLGTRMMAFLEPTKSSKETTVRITGESALLDVQADLSLIEPLPVPVREQNLQLDWSGLIHNGRGGAWVKNSVDRVTIARFPDMDAQELQDNFADVELLAEETWSWDLPGGEIALLGELVSQDSSFKGIDAQATWGLALQCTTCPNPAPSFFTVLKGCE